MWHDNTGTAAGVLPPGGFLEPHHNLEHPDTKRRIRNLLEVSGLYEELTPIKPRKATDEEILRVHTPGYLDKLIALDPTGGEAGPVTRFGVGGLEIARLSAGGVIAAVDAVLDGTVDNAYALVRPPGHHAMPDFGLGFCILCNSAIAGRHALAARGLKRIAFVDWDVHHGNGTQAAFWDEPGALTISIHQNGCFPHDQGFREERGEGAGFGYNLNVPLPPGCGSGAYEEAFRRVIIPALHAYKPELIIVPSGFDAGGWDPLGRMMIYSDCYRRLTAMLMEAADALCGGRLLMCHEGGYNAATVPFFGLAVLETMSGKSTGVEDPFLPFIRDLAEQELQPHQDAAIAKAEALLVDIK